MKERLAYIDVFKGILILFVVYDHLPDVYMYVLKQENSYMASLDEEQWLFKLFFMPAFFLATGFCSNFNKKFLPFVVSNTKSLLVPNICFGFLLGLMHVSSIEWKSILLHGGAFWFLSSLYMAKLIYWILIRYLGNNELLRWMILIGLVFIGFLLNSISINYDIFYFHYAFSLAIFLEIGRKIKSMKSDKSLYVCSFIYIGICVFFSFITIHKPVVAWGCICEVWETPLYIVSATTGSCMVLLLSKKIKHNFFLEYIGRESLIFYIFQIKVMTVLERFLLRYFVIDSWISVIIFVLTIYVMTILILSIVSKILDMRYVRMLKGEF